MKFYITNKKIDAQNFGKWYYVADKKCKVMKHRDTIYIYFGYLKNENLEERITQDFDSLINANGSFTCAKISSDRVEVIVDYFARYKVFAHKKNDLIEITNNFGLLDLSPDDLDMTEASKRLAVPQKFLKANHRTGEVAHTWDSYHTANHSGEELGMKEMTAVCHRTIFKNVYMLEPQHKLVADTSVCRIRLANFHNDVSTALKSKSQFKNVKDLESYIHEAMNKHSEVIKKQYRNIHCTLSEGIDSTLQTMYFPESKKSTYYFTPETVPFEHKQKILNRFPDTHIEEFQLDKIHEYCNLYSKDPSIYNFDILPSYCTLKNLDPMADIILYGAGGDEMFLHRSNAIQSQAFQMFYDLDPDNVLEKYNNFLMNHQNSYCAKKNIIGSGFQTLQEQYSHLDWTKPNEALATLSQYHRFPRDMRDHSLPKRATLGMYCRQISAECDTEITSMYYDLDIFFEVYKLTLRERIESTIDVGIQRNILQRFWDFKFETPYKDGASFNTYQTIKSYYKSALNHVFKDNLRDLITKER